MGGHVRCDGAVVALAGADGDGALAPLLARHVAGCLRCQAERARHRHLLRLLAQLRAEQVALGSGVLASVLDAVAAAGEDAVEEATRRGHPRRTSLAAGAGALGLLFLTGWAGLARQGRRRAGAIVNCPWLTVRARPGSPHLAVRGQ